MSILCSMVGASFASGAAGGRTAKTVTAGGNAQVSTAQFKFGTASALFDGTTNTRLNVAESISETGAYTIEFWFRKTANAGDLFYTQTETTGRGVLYFGSNGDLLYDTYSSGTPDFNNTGTQLASAMTSNVWHHIAFVRDASMAVRVYINGVASAQTGTSNVNFPTGGMWFGSRGYTGNIDEIRISNVARYNYNFPVATDAFNNDAYTTLLLHCNGANASTSFTDDAATTRTAVVPVRTGNVITSTAQFQFGTASGYSDGTGDSLVAPAINLYGD